MENSLREILSIKYGVAMKSGVGSSPFPKIGFQKKS